MALPDDQIRAFLDAAPDAIVIVDQRGKIAFVNVEVEAMFQYTRAELVGRRVEMLLPERFRDSHEDHLTRYFLAPRRRPMGGELELYGLRKDGTEFPVEVSLSPVSTEAGPFVSSAIRDVTARKVVEQKLIEAREFAEQANRAKSAFLAAASHDLRQPLQTLTLLSKVLSRAAPMDSRMATAVANQSEALRLMGELLNSLLDISKLEAGAVKPDLTDVSIRRIFERLRSEFAALAEAKGLELLVEECDAVVRTDPTLLSQIIQNLIGNAIRYTRRGCINLRCAASTETVKIEVLDTGIGIPSDELELIFDEFYQTRDGKGGGSREGVGLGLSIARRMADLLGCSLEARSTLGHGSRFSLTVPRAETAARTENYGVSATQTPFPADALVLIVDDDEAVANATSMLLGSLGIDCVATSGSAEALEAIENRGESPSLLICDYHLGGAETGVDVIRAIRDRVGSDLPAILVSGDTTAKVTEVLQGIESCRLLSKPVDAENLLELSARLLRARE
jgi:PAS domain S-box-containing protein